MRFRGDPARHIRGAGFVGAVANIAPRAVARMYDCWAGGEADKARDLHYRLHPLADLIVAETNPAPVKWVLHRAGLLGSAHVRPPLAPLGGPAEHTVLTLLGHRAPVLDAPVSALVPQP